MWTDKACHSVAMIAKRQGNDIVVRLSEPIPGVTMRVASSAHAVVIAGTSRLLNQAFISACAASISRKNACPSAAVPT